MAAVTYGVVCRPKPGNRDCGDAWAVLDDPARVVITVADGLGSGTAAHTASQLAVETVAAHREASLPRMLEACHEALRPTRGAAVGVLAVDLVGGRVSYAGVGNIEVRSPQQSPFKPISTGGIVGNNYRSPRVFEQAYRAGEWLVIHTDGLTTHFDLDRELREPLGGPQDLADRLAQAYAREHDDLTVVTLYLPTQ